MHVYWWIFAGLCMSRAHTHTQYGEIDINAMLLKAEQKKGTITIRSKSIFICFYCCASSFSFLSYCARFFYFIACLLNYFSSIESIDYRVGMVCWILLGGQPSAEHTDREYTEPKALCKCILFAFCGHVMGMLHRARRTSTAEMTQRINSSRPNFFRCRFRISHCSNVLPYQSCVN